MQGLYKLKLFQTAILLLSLTAESAVFAHSPHDHIRLLEISPAYAIDSTVFISIAPQPDHFGRLLKSTDGGGSWFELGNGLDNKSFLTSIAISRAFRVDQTMFIGSRGRVKLGHPVPESNLSRELKRGSPETMST